MDTITKVYVTKDYSVELHKYDIEEIVSEVREDLYNMPRPDDYTVADILTKVDIYAGAYIELLIEDDTEVEYCIDDLCEKQRTKEDYWHVIKLVLEQIEVIAK